MLGLCSWGRLRGISSLPINTRREGTKRTQPGSSQRWHCAQPGAQPFPLPVRQHCCAVRCRSPGRGCPEAVGAHGAGPCAGRLCRVRGTPRCLQPHSSDCGNAAFPQCLPAGAQGRPPPVHPCFSNRPEAPRPFPCAFRPCPMRAGCQQPLRVPPCPPVLQRPTEAIIPPRPSVRLRALPGGAFPS